MPCLARHPSPLPCQPPSPSAGIPAKGRYYRYSASSIAAAPAHPPLSISSGSRVIDTLSTVSRLRCRGWPTYRVDSRRTINSIHYLGWKGVETTVHRGHGFAKHFDDECCLLDGNYASLHKHLSRVLFPCSRVPVSRNHTRGTKRGVSLRTLYTSRTYMSPSPSSDSLVIDFRFSRPCVLRSWNFSRRCSLQPSSPSLL